MGTLVAVAIAFVVVIGVCLMVVRRRGPGEAGAVERGAARQELARGLAMTGTPGQYVGPGI